MEFELDDYRTGKIKRKRRNLSCLNEPGNYCKNDYNFINNKDENINNEKIKTDYNNNNFALEKPIYVNSNNNYLLTKLKKENENLRLRISKYENNNNRYKPVENKIKQKKIANAVRITKKIINNKPFITKSSNNFVNFANNTYTNNFYNAKNNKISNITNSSAYNNYNKNIINSNTMSTNSFVVNNKKTDKNKKKSFSVFRSSSKNKSKSKTKRIIYDKIKNNYKKYQNKLSNSNLMEMKIKGKKDDNIFNNLNINNLYNSRMNTLNNNMHEHEQKKILSWKKKNENEKNLNINLASSNSSNTDRKKTEVNISNSNSKDRNENIYIQNNEFNLTWSRFPKKKMETSFDQKNSEIILSSKNNKKILTKINSKNNNLLDKNEDNDNKIQIKRDVTPQKITINRRLINNKAKNNKTNFGSTNVSMKNINNIQQKNKKEEINIIKENIIYSSESSKGINFHNNLREGDIYVHKKRNSAYGFDGKYNGGNENEMKKNINLNNKYNVTINNINNCNYYNLIQGCNKPEYKIIKKKINKNNY